ncbi:MAG: hypothetical protein ABSA39_13465 [Edaphobacter sp.]
MTVREVLQIEIWSKRTSRKILIGLGIVVVLLVVGFVVLNTLDERWITPPERRAGRAALAQIEVLQNSDQLSDSEYDAGALQAKHKIDTAEQAAWTAQDQRIAAMLLGYFVSSDEKRSHRKLKLPPERPEDEALNKQAFQFIRSVLHRALD